MLLLSCVNCCFNALQHDHVGTTVGYCVEHRKLLNTPSRLTCGRHFRKDVLFETAERESGIHRSRFSEKHVANLFDRTPANGSTTSARPSDIGLVRRDAVGNLVADYGRLATKIVSLAQLRMLEGGRAEIALLALGRSYVRRCVSRGGLWSSGVHIAWWTRQKLGTEPDFTIKDLRVEAPIPARRQLELARWSTIMLRLVFLSDLGFHAKTARHRMRGLASLPEEAAAATGSLSPTKLLKWVRRNALPRFNWALSEASYAKLCDELGDEDAG